MDYLQRLFYPGTKIGAIDAAGKEAAVFGACRYLDVGEDTATAQYYSVTISEYLFMDLNSSSGYSVTAWAALRQQSQSRESKFDLERSPTYFSFGPMPATEVREHRS